MHGIVFVCLWLDPCPTLFLYGHIQSFADMKTKNCVWPCMSVTWLVGAYVCRSAPAGCTLWDSTSCCDFDHGACEDPLWGRLRTACQLPLLPPKIHSALVNRENGYICFSPSRAHIASGILSKWRPVSRITDNARQTTFSTSWQYDLLKIRSRESSCRFSLTWILLSGR